MSLLVRTTTVNEISLCGYVPDPHTVSLRDKGTWYALEMDGVMVSFLCIRKQRNELYIGEVFTAPEHRKKGLFSLLLGVVVDELYPGYSISTHALESSRAGFEAKGFKQFAFREFKYGNQYWLRRDGKKIDSKKV